jgi:hypothetical protein
MRALERRQGVIAHTRPTSGMTRFIGGVKVTVLSPAVSSRNTFDTYGMTINDAWTTLRITYPAARVAEDEERHTRSYLRLRDPWALILGADAQTRSWAQTIMDFPQLHPAHDPDLTKLLRATLGKTGCALTSSKSPPRVEARPEPRARGAHQATAVADLLDDQRPTWVPTRAYARRPSGGPACDRDKRRSVPEDRSLGIHTMYALDRNGKPLGSVAICFDPRRSSKLRLWRFRDGPRDDVDLAKGQEVNLDALAGARSSVVAGGV